MVAVGLGCLVVAVFAAAERVAAQSLHSVTPCVIYQSRSAPSGAPTTVGFSNFLDVPITLDRLTSSGDRAFVGTIPEHGFLNVHTHVGVGFLALDPAGTCRGFVVATTAALSYSIDGRTSYFLGDGGSASYSQGDLPQTVHWPPKSLIRPRFGVAIFTAWPQVTAFIASLTPGQAYLAAALLRASSFPSADLIVAYRPTATICCPNQIRSLVRHGQTILITLGPAPTVPCNECASTDDPTPTLQFAFATVDPAEIGPVRKLSLFVASR